MWGFSAEELADMEAEVDMHVEPVMSATASASPFWSLIFGGLEQHAEVDDLARVLCSLKAVLT